MCLARGMYFFEEHGGVAEGALGFALRLVEQRREIGRLVDDAHAAAAAAERRLDDQRKTDLLRGASAPRRDP